MRGVASGGRDGYFQHALALDFWPRRGCRHNNASEPRSAYTYLLRIARSRKRQSLQPSGDTLKATPHSGSPASPCPLHYAPLRRRPIPTPRSHRCGTAPLAAAARTTAGRFHRGPDPHFPPFIPMSRPLASPRLVQNPADGGHRHAIAVHSDGLFLDMFRVAMAVAVGSEAVMTAG